MHRPLVTRLSGTLLPGMLVFILSALLAGCAGYVNPLTGTTLAGGVPASQSRLLGTRLPSGMDFYPEHSRITGTEGMEILRGDASPAACASATVNGLQEQGWTARLASATEMRACYAFEKDGRLAVITIYPQSPTTMTLMTVYVSSSAPADMPLPVMKSRGLNFGSGRAPSSPSASDDGSYSGYPVSTEPLSTEPAASGGSPIVGRDI
ncbi:MAG: hypothetical protein Q4F72_01240 [Desulfovibrionaceae bacterium]|nr:hypothetical protein [Desulfovibrionaceae bacterium]